MNTTSTGKVTTLALFGGEPIRRHPFPPYRSLGPEEKRAVMEVMDEGILSDFIASPGERFYGGRRVRRLEEAWAEKFGVKHAVAMNSATSGIFAAVGAAGVGAGDEVIVSPFNMSCSASCAFVYNAIPVFADLEPDCFCLDPESIRANLSPYTKAIVVVSSFGQAADFAAIMQIAAEHHLMVIDDAAHVAGARYQDRCAGTAAHIGIYSLNAHKIIHCGEGGIAVTDDDELALRLRLIRNHAEAVVGQMEVESLDNMLGWNYRMTELEAAIAYEQLQKMDRLNAERRQLAEHLTRRLEGLPGIIPPRVRRDCTHIYYTYPILFKEEELGVSRARFLEAVVAEGIPFYARAAGYVKPYYLEPMFARKTVYANGCPFSCSAYKGKVDYRKGICPVTERLYEKEMIMNTYCYPPLNLTDMEDIADAFEKVVENRHALVKR